MRRHLKVLSAIALGMLLGTVTLVAHHSFATEFDATKPVKKQGYVTKIDWTNPHVWFYASVKDSETGKSVIWGFEMGPPHGLQARGWTRTTMKIGDEVIVDGTLARNGSNRVNARSVVMAKTGQRLGAASSEAGQDQ